NPAVDAMIEQIIFAKNRADLEAAARALDRILLWNHYVVPQWTYGKVRTARWDRFGHPDPMPKYGRAAFPTVWRGDAAKAQKTAGQELKTCRTTNKVNVEAGQPDLIELPIVAELKTAQRAGNTEIDGRRQTNKTGRDPSWIARGKPTLGSPFHA